MPKCIVKATVQVKKPAVTAISLPCLITPNLEESGERYRLDNGQVTLLTAMKLRDNSILENGRLLYLEGNRSLRDTDPKTIYAVLNEFARGQNYLNLSEAVQLLERIGFIRLEKCEWYTPYSMRYTYSIIL